jgi:hypothetical protein
MKYPGVYVTQLNENDVLQGRGSGSNQHPGNIKYRKMIENIASSYVSTPSRKEKNRMVQKLVADIHATKGRFLHSLGSGKAAGLGLDAEKDHFVEITDEDAIEKSKQAIRYVHYKKRPMLEKRRTEAAEENSTSQPSSSTVDVGADDRKMPPVQTDHTTAAGSDTSDPRLNQQQHLMQRLAQSVMSSSNAQNSPASHRIFSSQPENRFASKQSHHPDTPSSQQQHSQPTGTSSSSSSIEQLLQQLLPQMARQQAPSEQLLPLQSLASNHNPTFINFLSNILQPHRQQQQHVAMNMNLQSIVQHAFQTENAEMASMLIPLLRREQEQQRQRQLTSALQNLLPLSNQNQERSDDTSANLLRNILSLQQQQQQQQGHAQAQPSFLSGHYQSQGSLNQDQTSLANIISILASQDRSRSNSDLDQGINPQLTQLLLSRLPPTLQATSHAQRTTITTGSGPDGVSMALPSVVASLASPPLPAASSRIPPTIQEEMMLQQMLLLQQQQQQQQQQQSRHHNISQLMPNLLTPPAGRQGQSSSALQVSRDEPPQHIAIQQSGQYIGQIPARRDSPSSSFSGDSTDGREERKSRSEETIGYPARKRPRL